MKKKYNTPKARAAKASAKKAPHANAGAIAAFLAEHFKQVMNTGGLIEIAYSDAQGDVNSARLFPVKDYREAAVFAAARNRDRKNVYYGPALRRSGTPRNARAGDDAVLVSPAIWADFDKPEALARARKQLASLGLSPNCVCITGKYPHTRGQTLLYLKEPLTDAKLIKQLNEAVQQKLGGDAVSNASRVMRLPEAVAWPTPKKKGRRVEKTFLSQKGRHNKPASLKKVRTTLLKESDPPAHAPETQRVRAWALEALRTECDRVRAARKGDRNTTLNRSAFKLGQLVHSGELGRPQVESALREAASSTGLGQEEIQRVLRKAINDAAKSPRSAPSPSAKLPNGFALEGQTLYREHDGKREAFSSYLNVVATTRDVDGRQWGRLVELNDPDGNTHRMPLSAALIAQDCGEVRRLLCDRGFILHGGRRAASDLSDLIMRWMPSRRATVVNNLGWTSDACRSFVFANGNVAGAGDYVYQPQSPASLAKEMTAAGTLADWRSSVSIPCVGNPLLLFALSAAFAGPLIELVGAESAGVHFRGESSKGKTTLLRGASSVWGSRKFMQTWRATANALEGLAATTNGTLLALDEIGEIDRGAAGQIIYTLANGVSKARATVSGDARPRASWTVMIISSGEVSFADTLLEPGGAKAGQQIRLMDIPADRRSHGVFDALPSGQSAAKFSKMLKRATRKHYGTAGPAFVSSLIGRRTLALGMLRSCQASLRERLHVKGDAASGQVQRGVDHFALIATAGELAARFGVTGWSKGVALEATVIAAKLWIKERGGLGATESKQALDRTRSFLSQHGASRFERSGQAQPVSNRAGVYSNGHFYILEDAWRYMHQRHDPRRAAQYLRELGYLLPGDGAHLKRKAPGSGIRCYCISERILDASTKAK